MSTFRLSVDYLKDDIVRQFNLVDHEVMRWMTRAIRVKGGEIAYEHATITPAEKTIAERIHRTVGSVSRSLNRLSGLGVLTISRRRKRDGTFFINKYGLGEAFKSMLRSFINIAKGVKPVHLRADAKVLNSEQQEENYFGHFVSFLRNLRKGTDSNLSPILNE